MAAGEELLRYYKKLSEALDKELDISDYRLYGQLLTDGMPGEVLLVCAEYCCNHRGNTKPAYVCKVALDWYTAKKLTTRELAEDYVDKRVETRARIYLLASDMGHSPQTLPNRERFMIKEWFEKFGFDLDMIDFAREQAGPQKNNIPYVNAILKAWHGKGYTQPGDVPTATAQGLYSGSGHTNFNEKDLLANYEFDPNGIVKKDVN